MEALKQIKEQLTSCVQGQMGNLASTDTKELGEVVDMIKDLAEAEYYCTITEAMKESDKDKESSRYYTHPMYYRDMDRDYGRMYYTEQGMNTGNAGISTMGMNAGNSRSYEHSSHGATTVHMPMTYANRSNSRSYEEMPLDIRDRREGMSHYQRRNYMESKELKKDKQHQMKELERYVQELGSDIVEMIEDTTPEEKQFLAKKIQELSSKIIA